MTTFINNPSAPLPIRKVELRYRTNTVNPNGNTAFNFPPNDDRAYVLVTNKNNAPNPLRVHALYDVNGVRNVISSNLPVIAYIAAGETVKIEGSGGFGVAHQDPLTNASLNNIEVVVVEAVYVDTLTPL